MRRRTPPPRISMSDACRQPSLRRDCDRAAAVTGVHQEGELIMSYYDGMDPEVYRQELLDRGADPEDANAAAEQLKREQRR